MSLGKMELNIKLSFLNTAKHKLCPTRIWACIVASVFLAEFIYIYFQPPKDSLGKVEEM